MMNAMLPTGQMPEEVSQALERGERLLWVGAPQRGFKLRAADIYLIPFSLFWAGFAVFWESSVLAIQGSPFFMKLWGIPFVLVGLYLVVGRFFVDAKMREWTVYAVTSQRALIFSGMFRREMKSLTLRNLPEVSVVKAYDGSGTISEHPALFGLCRRHCGLARKRSNAAAAVRDDRRRRDGGDACTRCPA